MGEDEIGSATIRKHDLPEKLLQIRSVIVEAGDVTAHRVADQAIGGPLPPPVEHCHGQSAVAEIAYRLEIFLDALIAPGKDDDCALERTNVWREACVAQAQTVARRKEAAGSVVGARIAGNVEKQLTHAVGFVQSRVRSEELARRS